MDEILLKVGLQVVWLLDVIEPENRQILTLFTSKERNMFVAERFIAGLVKEHKRHPISTDEGIWFPDGLSLSQT